MPKDLRKYCNKLLDVLDSYFACAFAGALMPLGFAPFDNWWLCWLLLIPLLIAAQLSDPIVRLKRGAVFGIFYFSIGLYWLIPTLANQLDFSTFSALLGHLIIAGACAFAPTVFCWMAGYLYSTSSVWPLTLAAAWLFTEDIRFQAFGGGPWMSLGLSQVEGPLVSLVPVVGEIGISIFVVWLNYLALSGLRVLAGLGKKLDLMCNALMFIVTVTGSFWLGMHEWTRPTGETLSVAMVQTATKQSEKVDPNLQKSRLKEFTQLSEIYLGQADLIVWPETVVTITRTEIIEELQELAIAAQRQDTTFLIGAFEKAIGQSLYNTMFTLGHESGQRYRKRHLVPFGESMPSAFSLLDPYFPGDQFRQFSQFPELIAINGQLLGVSICWEGNFSRDISQLVSMGASALVNVANEAWFFETVLPAQNLQAMRIRAMETGRPMIRVANLGPSAIIDHNGELTALLDAEQAGATMQSLQTRVGETPFMWIGSDFFPMLSLILILYCGIWRYLKRRHN